MHANPDAKHLSPFDRTVGELLHGPGISVPRTTSIHKAARMMSEKRVGSLVVVAGDKPVGLVTKTDMVRRVMAKGKNVSAKVADVMTPEIVTIAADRPLFDGLMLMIQNDIGHLVVTDGGKFVGVISERDWLNFQKQHPAALFKDIGEAESPWQLAAYRDEANTLVRRFFGNDGTAAALTSLVTEINDRVVERVIALVLQEKGPAPVPFAWIAMGSEGRMEQTLSTDQDNGLVFEEPNRKRWAAHRKWFLDFAERVVEGLVICGFPRCKGNTMASNPELCLSMQEWRLLFARIVQKSDPEAVMQASIFFDFRSIFGDGQLVDALWSDLWDLISLNKGFMRFLAGESEIFGGLPIHSVRWKLRELFGMTPRPIDIKKQALNPAVRSLRVIALERGIAETNTLRRLEVAREIGALPERLADAVHSAYDFVMLLRIRQHFRQQEQGETPTNRIDFRRLNALEGRFLVEALQTIAELESHVMGRYGGVVVQ